MVVLPSVTTISMSRLPGSLDVDILLDITIDDDTSPVFDISSANGDLGDKAVESNRVWTIVMAEERDPSINLFAFSFSV